MEETADTFNNKTIIPVSRNRPLALIANACTFLGSALTRDLLEKGIQVIAVDDLSLFDKRKLEEFARNKHFHLINFALDNDEVLQKFEAFELERLDYGFFITDKSVPDLIIGRGVANFIEIIRQIRDRRDPVSSGSKSSEKSNGRVDRPRLAFISSIDLYGKSSNPRDRILQEAEIKFARGIKHYKLNGRVVRISEIFGPRMELENENPLSILLLACLNDCLDKVPVSFDYTHRSLYIDDAVTLLAKSVLSGATSNKIYDGALLHPVKLSEIKQILADPMWFEQQKGEITKLPAWPTPNLHKTIKELNWTPKTPLIKALRETISYFKEHKDEVPDKSVEKPSAAFTKNWSFAGTGFLGDESIVKSKELGEKVNKKETAGSGKKGAEGEFENEFREHKKNTFFGKTKRRTGLLIVIALIIYGLIWPFIYLGYEAINIRNQILESKLSLEAGDFPKSEESIQKARVSMGNLNRAAGMAKILGKIPWTRYYYLKAGSLLELTEQGIEGVYFATRGSQALFETTKIISGESREDPDKYYLSAQRDLDFASDKLSRVYALSGDGNLKQGLPQILEQEIDKVRERLSFYVSLVGQTQTASSLMPKITGLEGKKSYLILLQNNLELRPTGGFIGSYAKLDFERGRLTNIKVDDIYSLDGALKEVIAPPLELKQDLGIERLYLRDSNFEPDFPTSARQASFFYKKEAGEIVNGVIALDLKASGDLLDAVGGLDLPEYGESVNGTNLFERAISHAETGFFPGSQAKKNYLTSLQTQMFNKIFYLSKQNWPAIIQAISKSLAQKHIMIYLEDPSLFSSLASSNWSGVFPRGSEKIDGETQNFLAVIESNMGANKSNYFLQRKVNLQTSFTKEGKINHKLKIIYKNTSPSEIFPAGRYKNRFKIYTPIGTKLIRAMFGENDITSKFSSFSDYGRAGFSTLIEIAPKEQKQLVLEYEPAEALNFKEGQVLYKLEIFKQPGLMADPLDFILNYPINFKLEEKPESGNAGVQEVKIQTDMQTDRVFQFKIKK